MTTPDTQVDRSGPTGYRPLRDKDPLRHSTETDSGRKRHHLTPLVYGGTHVP